MMKIVLLIFLIIYSYTGYCCTCLELRTIHEELELSANVLKGKIISKKTIELTDTSSPEIKMQQVAYRLKVSVVFKGKLKEDTIWVITGFGGGDCGFDFKLGTEYIVYGYLQNYYHPKSSDLSYYIFTDDCTRTRLGTDLEELKTLSYLVSSLR